LYRCKYIQHRYRKTCFEFFAFGFRLSATLTDCYLSRHRGRKNHRARERCDPTLTAAWGVDDDIMEDMCVVFRLASRANSYSDIFGYGPQFEAILRAWRPELVKD
jgi:hypothetical protein